jgi:cytochrome c oxidase subunit 2
VLATLFWVMLIGAAVLWLTLNGLFLFATRLSPANHSRRFGEGVIVIGGVVLPVAVLAVLLIYGLSIMPDQRAPGQGVRIAVTGEQWWWRVDYILPDGRRVAAANEIRLPVGQRTEIALISNGVIHSFWVPALGGKTDMIPGRINRMSLLAERVGVFRGQCAEFCGASHALMAFQAVAMAPADFDAWLTAQAAGAMPPDGATAQRGAQVFAAQGCGGCHAVRGTPAVGNVGPDLTHVGGRESIAAGVLPVTAAAFARFIADPAAIKPEVQMPPFEFLSGADLAALGTYLEGLK